MGRRALNSIQEVVDRQLCLGCGACAYAQPDVIKMADAPDYGVRPVLATRPDADDVRTDDALAVCPGVSLAHSSDAFSDAMPELAEGWGPVLEVWEGYAGDPAIRYAGSSGGAATALALHCLEEQGMHGILHIKARDDVPYLNETTLSRSRDEMLAATGSRYAPASPCDRLDLVEESPHPCVFIGKPCDVAATSKARARNERLDENLGLTIAIFCAGTPSTRGTLEMLEQMGIDDPSQVTSLRYRGNGWPGMAEASVRTSDGGSEYRRLTYDESWGKILQRHRQWRCYICPDHTGEFADIAVGDPWYREIPPGEPGRSLVVARTQRGRRILNSAVAAGALTAEPADPGILPASQPNLLHARGATWGRVVASGWAGAATPRFRGFSLRRVWLKRLTVREKARSLLGTFKRVARRRLYRRVQVDTE
ncbi:coenzyme F420 hydrogenase [Egibacter rhizosphaerae]|uniref:Coenzyme F420 hydrogenase n=1 Tax=Egibacter rhizosphaerae TaxID=1670831 RepID=A0A411YGK9_9ACTN|nr:Coenzyme F420 hydrogenase/dehydrogenase, beta subunit C-terminal domain [Egibacter rhizosphaerae]QBI20281.1 coenzyme F420 hydrogenase [Egibacter rhizosphaerae]